MPLEENILLVVSEIVVRTARGDFIDQDKTNNFCIRNYGRNLLFNRNKTRCLTSMRTRIFVHNCDNNCNNRSSEFKSGE